MEPSKKFFVVLFLFFVSTILVSCGQREPLPLEANQALHTSDIIVGDLSWTDVTKLSSTSTVRKVSKSVAYISIPAQDARCTGFLITKDILMTNQHCIVKASDAKGVVAFFNYESGVAQDKLEPFACDEFIGNDKTLDFALLKCKGSPGDKYGVVELDDATVSNGKSIFVVQQNCDYYADPECTPFKKVANGKITEVGTELGHDADTLGGSSGSPVFAANSNKVIAIHHVGMGNDGSGHGSMNYAVPMSKIVPLIKSKFTTVFGSSSTASTGYLDLPSTTFGKIRAAGEEDTLYFKVTSSTKKVTVNLNLKNLKGDLDLYLFDGNANLIAQSETTKDLEQIVMTLKKGTYIIMVVGYDGAIGDYSLQLK